jgi:hypothetical protein
MRRVTAIFFWMVAAALAADRPAARPYFTTDRPIAVSDGRQNYVVIDDDIWRHARADLGDLRLYDAAGAEVPYALVLQGARSDTRPVQSKLFNLAKGAHGTEFLLEMYPEFGQARQFDRVTLQITAKDFVGKADVEASDVFSAAKWAQVGTYSIFDFTREKLGSNFELRMPPLRYRFLRIVLHALVSPDQVKGASVADFQTQAASWVATGTTPQISQGVGSAKLVPGDLAGKLERERGRFTIISWSQPEHAPLERIVFDVAGTNNFRRGFELFDDKAHVLASGEISRVHMQKEGQIVDWKQLEAEVPGLHSPTYLLLVYNGDDPPLPIESVHPQSIERRVYFDPGGHSGLKLYYGDEKTSAPVYDYAKLFQLQPEAARASLGGEEHNAAFTGRPDDRPWSDRHQWVMWAALILAVVVLGAVALRGMKA